MPPGEAAAVSPSNAATTRGLVDEVTGIAATRGAPPGTPPGGPFQEPPQSTPAAASGMSQDLVITLSCQLHEPHKPCDPDLVLSHAPARPSSLPRAVRAAVSPAWRDRTGAADVVKVPTRQRQPAARGGAAAGCLPRGAAPLPDVPRPPGVARDMHVAPAPTLWQERAPHRPSSPSSRWQWARGAVVCALPIADVNRIWMLSICYSSPCVTNDQLWHASHCLKLIWLQNSILSRGDASCG